MTATEFDVNVHASAFRAALNAVGPHASDDPEDGRLNRIRVYLAARTATVVATNGQTAAMALVGITDHLASELGCFDMLTTDARKVLAIFKGGKGDDESMVLRLHATAKHLEVTDVGGLFPGQSLRLNACPVDPEFPNVAAAIKFAQRRSLEMVDAGAPFLAVSPTQIKRFIPAGLHYGPLVIEPTGNNRAMVVTAADSFIGLLVPVWASPASTKRDREIRQEWWNREDDITLSHPLPKPKVKAVVVDSTEPTDDGPVTLEGLLSGRQSEPIDLDAPADDEPADGEVDDLLARARNLVVAEQRCGRPFLIRELGITQAQFKYIIDTLEAEGVVGPPPGGSESRQVLVAGPLFSDGAE